jgi:hypothetical protein
MAYGITAGLWPVTVPILKSLCNREFVARAVGNANAAAVLSTHNNNYNVHSI